MVSKMCSDIKKTRIHSWHIQNKANMAQFGQYDMPLWYPSGARKEHLAVLTHAGMFDTSHMSVITVKGSGARDLLQFCFTKNLSACIGKDQLPLSSGKSVYGAFLNQKGEVIDDAIVFQLYNSLYMVVVNAGMGGVICKHLQGHVGAHKAAIVDLTDQVGKLDVQGPQSARVVSHILSHPDEVLSDLPFFSFKGYFNTALPVSEKVRLKDGTPFMLSRTGYTGEFGFELFVSPDNFIDLWHQLLEVGQSFGMLVCGLASRDSLRAGAVLPLSHQDIGPWLFKNNPWPFALPYASVGTSFTKDFLGAKALQDSANHEFTYPFVGYDLRKVAAGDPSEVYVEGEQNIGTVLTCATDMAIGRVNGKIYSIASPDKPAEFNPKGLCCGFIKVNKSIKTGEKVTLKDKNRSVKVEIVKDIRPARTARKPLASFL
jgi:aminomethyltransferase